VHGDISDFFKEFFANEMGIYSLISFQSSYFYIETRLEHLTIIKKMLHSPDLQHSQILFDNFSVQQKIAQILLWRMPGNTDGRFIRVSQDKIYGAIFVIKNLRKKKIEIRI
jgi:hypothetical protein